MVPNPAPVYTLHRYYLWSTILKDHYYEALAGPTERGEAFSLKSDEGIVAFAYLCYWYAALYVVVEGWKKLELHDPQVDELLKSPNVEFLKLYRHNVFHFHEDYFNPHLTMPLIDSADNPVVWVRALSNELGRWFLDWFKTRRESESG
jgi:hypothetical protein